MQNIKGKMSQDLRKGISRPATVKIIISKASTVFPVCTKKHLCEQDMSYTGALYLTKVIQIIIFQAQPSNGHKP